MGHWGGQLTWEVKDSERMVVCWRSAMVLARAGVDINTMRAWRMSPEENENDLREWRDWFNGLSKENQTTVREGLRLAITLWRSV